MTKELGLYIKGRNYCNSCNRYCSPKSTYCCYCGELITDSKLYFVCWLENTRMRQSNDTTRDSDRAFIRKIFK
jgi:hypothetical protein